MVFQKSLLSFYRFWVQNVKINFLEKKYFQCRFYRTEVHVVTNWSSRLEKTSNKTLNFVFGRLFNQFLKYHICRDF